MSLVGIELVLHVVYVGIECHKSTPFKISVCEWIRPGCCHTSFENGRL